jgi:hypothetical protein
MKAEHVLASIDLSGIELRNGDTVTIDNEGDACRCASCTITVPIPPGVDRDSFERLMRAEAAKVREDILAEYMRPRGRSTLEILADHWPNVG